MKKMDFYFFRLLWTFIHLIYSACDFIKLIFYYFYKLIKGLLYDKTFESDLTILSSAKEKLEKLPYHLVFIIGNEKMSYPDLAKMIFWCLAAGISYLSFHDHKGK